MTNYFEDLLSQNMREKSISPFSGVLIHASVQSVFRNRLQSKIPDHELFVYCLVIYYTYCIKQNFQCKIQFFNIFFY